MVRLIRDDGSHEGFLKLIGLLDKELRSRSSDHDELYIRHNLIEEPAKVVLAMDEGKAVGCACLREKTAETAELKRMYVLPAHRGRGLSRLILRELETWAEGEGINRIVLETGAPLKAAVSLYESAGYRRIPNYPPYEGIDESRCYGKDLS